MQLAQSTSDQRASIQATTETSILDVGGMKCAGCVKAVERQLTQQPGVISATVNLATEIATVDYEGDQIKPENLAEKLTAAGFPSQPRQSTLASRQEAETSHGNRHTQEMRQQTWRIVICCILIVLSGLGHLHHLGFGHIPILGSMWFHWELATYALLFPGRQILVDGFCSLFRNAPNMNTLVALGVLTAYVASFIALVFPQLGWECFFMEPVMLLGFILLGKTLEQRARYRAARALRSLLALQPVMARLVPQPEVSDLQDGDEQALAAADSIEIPADHVRVGEWLKVLPGEKIPVDGEVRQGKTTVDESMLTGEAMPVVKHSGNPVSAGTLNHSGMVLIQATRTGEDTTLAQIIRLVEAAQTRKAPIQNLADAVSGYFTYGVMALATLTFLFWQLVGTRIWPDVLNAIQTDVVAYAPFLLSLKLTIDVLVIACPCALGLATPMAILVGSGLGAERGLLIKGGDVLEQVHRLDTVVFDKTGTLTTGKLQVTDCVADSAISSDELLQLAVTIEAGSEHPIAQAICNAAQEHGVSPLKARDFHTEPGLGISAISSINSESQTLLAGNAAWLYQNEVELPTDLPEFSGKTLVHVAAGDHWVGTIAVSDTLRPDAKSTVNSLRKRKLRVMLLTGDRAEVAEAIAKDLNLEPANVIAEVRPQDKAEVIAQIQDQGQRVAMVGDGINDAPALSQADVGISLHTGTQVAMEAADIVLMQDSLTSLEESIRLSRATFNKIRQNLFWAFGYNVVGIPVAAGLLLPSLGIILNPTLAGAMMAFSSVSVVTNSLLLRRQFQ